MQNNNIQEKNLHIDNLEINYKTIGSGDVVIVILHGWGISSDKYIELADYLSKAKYEDMQIRVLVPDLPGFGKSDEPKENWDLDDYVSFVDKFIDTALQRRGFEKIKNILSNFDPRNRRLAAGSEDSHLNKRRITLIGHSFGGRIAIKYSIKHPEKIEKLVLTGAAGIKHSLGIKKSIIYIFAKIGKIFFNALNNFVPITRYVEFSRKIIYRVAGEKDYHNASPRMKEIMKNILSENLYPVLENIKVPTLLLWGKEDRSTPLSDGVQMNRNIANSQLVVFNDTNHGLPYKKAEAFSKAVIDFLNKN